VLDVNKSDKNIEENMKYYPRTTSKKDCSKIGYKKQIALSFTI
jgi:hypothetical protein